MKKMRHAFDLSGHPVFFESFLPDKNNKQLSIEHLHLRIAKTIEHPTIVIDVIDVYQKRYYFRAINWEHTLLVCVRITQRMHEVEQYIENPSGKFMAQLYRKATYATL
jgi:hypothetical protein